MAMLAGTGRFLLQHVIGRLPGRGRMLAIARMGMNWSIDDLIRHLQANKLAYAEPVAERIRRQNSRYTWKDFFELLGFADYQDVDLDPEEGCSILHDMNQPLPAQYANCFDFVMENGTIEHIFDIKTAIGNIAQAVKVGGVVCHVSPLDAFNHGFYNFSINFFNDFYRANGFDDCEFYLLRMKADWVHDQNMLIEPCTYTHEEFYLRPEVHQSPYNKLMIGFVAAKKRHFPAIVVPTQGAYDPKLRLPSPLNRFGGPAPSRSE